MPVADASALLAAIRNRGAQTGPSNKPSRKPTGRGHASQDEILERYEPTSSFVSKVEQLANLIKSSKRVVVYTGAGISTAAKIPDYRGPNGVWTKRDQGKRPEGHFVTIDQAIPTLSHMCLSEMVKKDIVRHVVSTNIDGLHCRSGVPDDKLSELHGNSFKEVCNTCKKSYHRTFDVTSQGCRRDHQTGNTCACGGKLLDTIIHFSENLPKRELQTAAFESAQSDLALVIGTSMRVRPACELPAMTQGKMVICNKQTTPFDSHADLLIHADLDDVFSLLAKKLNLTIPSQTPDGFDVTQPLTEKDLLDSVSAKYAKFAGDAPSSVVNPTSVTRTKKPSATTKTSQKGTLRLSSQSLLKISVSNADNEVTARAGQPVLVNNSANANLTIHGKPSKIMIENCINCKITIASSIRSGQLDLLRCQQTEVSLSSATATVSIDLSQQCKVVFSQGMKADVSRVYANDSSDVQLLVSFGGYLSSHRIPNRFRHSATCVTRNALDQSFDILSQEVVHQAGAGAVTKEEVKKTEERRSKASAAIANASPQEIAESTADSSTASGAHDRAGSQVYTFTSGEHVISCGPKQTVILSDCRNCVIRLPSVVLKVIVSNSDNCSVHIQRVRIGMVEVVRSTGCQINFTRAVPTITFDLCSNTTLGFSRADLIGSIVAADCNNNCAIAFGETKAFIPESKEQTMISHDGNQVVVEKTVRERGYLMTKQAHEQSKLYQARAEKIMLEHVRKMIHFGDGKKFS